MYYIIYGIFYVISLLPIRALYVISDLAYGLIYYVIGYRKKVVMGNLTIAFPEKSQSEKEVIAKKFYHNFVDSFIETIKMISASDEYILKRFTGNWEVVNDLLKSGVNAHILLGHTFNWEWGNLSIGLNLRNNLLVVYMPISNKIFDRLFLKLRTRGKTKMLSAHNMRRDLMPHRNTQYVLGLAADQNPGNPGHAYWLNFFTKAAPFVTGPEKGARPKNLPVFFCYIEKLRRGYYNMVFSVGESNPKSLPEGALTIKFVNYLESVIRMQPDMWLWSHNRWKHEWKEEYVKLWIDDEEPKL